MRLSIFNPTGYRKKSFGFNNYNMNARGGIGIGNNVISTSKDVTNESSISINIPPYYMAPGETFAGLPGPPQIKKGVLKDFAFPSAAEIVIAIGLEASDQLTDSAEIANAFGSPAEIGRQFLSNHLLVFEAISIVLLIAAIGGVLLGTERTKGRDQEQVDV